MAPWVGYFPLEHVGQSSRPQTPAPRFAFQGTPRGFVDHYEQYGRTGDPLLAHVAASHSPAFLELSSFRVAQENDTSQAGGQISSVSGAVPAAPALLAFAHRRERESRGTLSFARLDDHPFGLKDVGLAGAMSLHVSIRLSALGKLPTVATTWRGVLTPRDMEMVEMVALGLTNAEVGTALCVSANAVKKHLTRMFLRLGVSSRAELVSLLLRGSPDWVA